MTKQFTIFSMLLILFACGIDKHKTPIEKTKEWKSSFHPVSFSYGSNWTFIEPHTDSEEKLQVGLMDFTNRKWLTIKISPDVSKDLLSDSSYWQATKEQMLAAHPENKLLAEKEVNYHGKNHHLQVFKMQTRKMEYIKMFVYVFRDGKHLTGTQICFPYDEAESTFELPDEILELEKNLKIDE